MISAHIAWPGEVNPFDWSTNQNASKIPIAQFRKIYLSITIIEIFEKVFEINLKKKLEKKKKKKHTHTNFLMQFLWQRILHSNYFRNYPF